MFAFRDRDKATHLIGSLLQERSMPWIVLSGGSKIGKTSFAKTIAEKDKSTVLCQAFVRPDSYATLLIMSIQPDKSKVKELISAYMIEFPSSQEILAEYNTRYVYDIPESDIENCLKWLIKRDMSSLQYTFAKFLSQSILADVHCAILDDFHWCDTDSYRWILQFFHLSPQTVIIAVCNFDLPWESESLLAQFQTITSPINLNQFDSDEAYFEILRDNFPAENDLALRDTAKTLFKLYDGDSWLLFETIRIAQQDQISTNSGEFIQHDFLKLAERIHTKRFDGLGLSHWLALCLLACSPVPLTKENILDMMDLESLPELGTAIIADLYNNAFIVQDVDAVSGTTLYSIYDDFIRKIALEKAPQPKGQYFCNTKIFRAIQKESICATKEQALDLALKIEAAETSDLLGQVLALPDNEVSFEKKAAYLDRFISYITPLPKDIVSFANAKLLYDFGHYGTSSAILNVLQSKSAQFNYEQLMLLGDTQHLLLAPETSETYRQAASIEGISVSEKLMAINRQIMALNQEHKEEQAQALYRLVLRKYSCCECVGLVELYRNTNNSFGYQEAIDYTFKGYFMAKNLGEELEAYKCLHNLCMIQLQYGHYGEPFAKEKIGFEPTFDIVLEFLSRKPEYRHEQAYPLLDLGTVAMFNYVEHGDTESLRKAKRMYSEAQLYAKSFYSQHIAETGLLIVNSYLYCTQEPSYLCELRKAQFERYLLQKDQIADQRVHRKILLSLALSALIGGDTNEAASYLSDAQPYIQGPETLRFNRLCQRAGCTDYQKERISLEGKYALYYGSDCFVPWLISFCH